ncbi:hypothetical protein AMAG_05022 [Allomyces macrogynus ATCC 38327]|uniref:Amidohydrolase-related domain-containing protein n=1 Tax=Allomyces macrogynus (strain ATCC 38327) TaxID=578462 RepID=A0A0L0S703_ALLM3|nr:hypothetical protein AMAG_05022 [Allomyces macrogynus ATCC 38327]|eukprot:KNE58210.1 hypothetical protein AMAG_05022 [Allomyces macrogynus ATCC 38327]
MAMPAPVTSGRKRAVGATASAMDHPLLGPFGAGHDSDASFSSSSTLTTRATRKKRRQPRHWATLALVVSALLVAGAYWYSPTKHHDDDKQPELDLAHFGPRASLLSRSEFDSALSFCRTGRAPGPRGPSTSPVARINPRDASHGLATLIRNATVWDGLGGVFPHTDVLLRDGVIAAVGTGLHDPDGVPVHVIQAHGRILTPGIVDMHSHAGVDVYPGLGAGQDTNEVAAPATPGMRTVDAFDPRDPALKQILAGGVTTILVLPGSTNLMGGEAFAFKTPTPASNSVDDMLLHAGITAANADQVGGYKWRWAKHACGENPKAVYGNGKGKMPFTRMGNAYLVREQYAQAAKLRDEQDEWCAIAEHLDGHKKKDADTVDAAKKKKKKHKKKKRPLTGPIVHPHGRFPTSLALEPVVALLRGQVKLNWHCYEVHDLTTQMRIAREFNVSIAAFHHASDIHEIIPALKTWEAEGRTPIGAAIFADEWGYKKEAYQASVYAPQILEQHGIPFAFKSDHPVLHAQWLAYESGKAAQYGLNDQSVIRALTSAPARLMGVDHRIGSVAVGMDADVVLWPSNPLAAGAIPDAVFVDGALVHENKVAALIPNPPPIDLPVPTKAPPRVQVPSAATVWLRGIRRVVTGAKTLHFQELVIENGRIVCLATHCNVTDTANVVRIDLRGAVITPTLVAGGTQLGLVDITGEEEKTGDGEAKSDDLVYGRDALQAGGNLERSAANQGVGLIISPPNAKPASGALAFRVSAVAATNYSLPHVVRPIAAVHTAIGGDATEKGTAAGSVSGQIAALRRALTAAAESRNATDEDAQLWQDVAHGRVPLVIHTNSANHIAAVLRAKDELDPRGRQKWVIAGAAEAHLAIDLLADANRRAHGSVGVLIMPARCATTTWDARRCLMPPAAPFRGAVHLAALLKQHEVPFALGMIPNELGRVRNLRFEAAWVQALAGLSEEEAVHAVSTGVLDLLTGRGDGGADARAVDDVLAVGGYARFNVWTGSVGDLHAQLALAVDGVRAKMGQSIVQYPAHQ